MDVSKQEEKKCQAKEKKKKQQQQQRPKMTGFTVVAIVIVENFAEFKSQHKNRSYPSQPSYFL